MRFYSIGTLKYALVVFAALSLGSQSLNAQVRRNEGLINYLEQASNLDPIEGIWTLNVVRTLSMNGAVVGEETEVMLSEWVVLRKDKFRFEVIDIGAGSRYDKGQKFTAYFESTARPGVYTYRCDFKSPHWTAKSYATLTDEVFIEYEYDTSEAYLKKAYGANYRPGMNLHWKFFWTKKFPQVAK